MKSIQKNLSLRAIDSGEAFGLTNPETIRVPARLTGGGGLGVTPALVQALGTWAKKNETGALRPYGTEAGLDAYSELVRTAHGMCAVYFSHHHQDGTGNALDSQSVLKLLEPATAAMNQSRLRDTEKGPGVFLCCFSGSDREHLLPLYSNPAKLRGTADFEDLTDNLLETVGVKKPDAITVKVLATIIFELFENTHDHARKDENGVPYDFYNKNVRALSARRISIASKTNLTSAARAFNQFLGDSESTITFSNALLDSRTKNTHFIELAVVDTGPGIAEVWSSSKGEKKEGRLNHVQQLAAVKEAFEVGATTKTEGKTGHGLRKVVEQLVTLRAIMRLRTGNLSVTQMFSPKTTAFDPVLTYGDCPLPHMVGTRYTILFPLL